MRVVLPPLSDRLTRIRLLAWSYLDAVEQPCGGDGESVNSGEAPGSIAPSRNDELWRRGSYRQFEQALDRLPRGLRRAMWREHITASRSLRSKERASLEAIARLMPRTVFVPAEIAEAAGFLPSEAKVYSR